MRPGYYTAPNASITIHVIKTFYEGPEYTKVRCALYSKYSKELIQLKTFKLYHDRVDHWRRYENNDV